MFSLAVSDIYFCFLFPTFPHSILFLILFSPLQTHPSLILGCNLQGVLVAVATTLTQKLVQKLLVIGNSSLGLA